MIGIPVRESKPGEPESLRYVLRSIAQHLPEEMPIVIGHRPDWYLGEHFPTAQALDKHQNIGINLKVATSLADQFVWWSDDTYILKDSTPAVYARNETVDHLLARVGEIPWKRALRSQRKILIAWGYDPSTLLCSESHHPMLIDSARAREIMDRVSVEFPDHPLGSFKGLYGAGLEVIPQKDPKVLHVDRSIDPDANYLSTAPVTFRQGLVGRELRALFPAPSPYER